MFQTSFHPRLEGSSHMTGGTRVPDSGVARGVRYGGGGCQAPDVILNLVQPVFQGVKFNSGLSFQLSGRLTKFHSNAECQSAAKGDCEAFADNVGHVPLRELST